MTKESLNGRVVQHYTFMYFDTKAGVFKDFRVVLLSRSLLNFLRTFASLILNTEQFLRVWENFAPSPGISTIILRPGGGN